MYLRKVFVKALDCPEAGCQLKRSVAAGGEINGQLYLGYLNLPCVSISAFRVNHRQYQCPDDQIQAKLFYGAKSSFYDSLCISPAAC